jgi:hypothetical protein
MWFWLKHRLLNPVYRYDAARLAQSVALEAFILKGGGCQIKIPAGIQAIMDDVPRGFYQYLQAN